MVVADGAHAPAAYLQAPGSLIVESGSGLRRSVAVPVGCVPTAATEGAVALVCTGDDVSGKPVVVDVANGALSPVGASGERIERLGTEWASVSGSVSPDLLHVLQTRTLVNRRTGQRIALDQHERYGPHRFLDLDRPRPARRLCRPLARNDHPGIDDIKYQDVREIEGWALVENLPDGSYVQRCAARKRVSFSYHATPVLGRGFVAYLSKRMIVMRDLRTGRRRTHRWPTATRPTLAAARDRLYVATPEQGQFQIFRAR